MRAPRWISAALWLRPGLRTTLGSLAAGSLRSRRLQSTIPGDRCPPASARCTRPPFAPTASGRALGASPSRLPHPRLGQGVAPSSASDAALGSGEPRCARLGLAARRNRLAASASGLACSRDLLLGPRPVGQRWHLRASPVVLRLRLSLHARDRSRVRGLEPAAVMGRSPLHPGRWRVWDASVRVGSMLVLTRVVSSSSRHLDQMPASLCCPGGLLGSTSARALARGG
jgi:hypothetical protein